MSPRRRRRHSRQASRVTRLDHRIMVCTWWWRQKRRRRTGVCFKSNVLMPPLLQWWVCLNLLPTCRHKIRSMAWRSGEQLLSADTHTPVAFGAAPLTWNHIVGAFRKNI